MTPLDHWSDAALGALNLYRDRDGIAIRWAADTNIHAMTLGPPRARVRGTAQH